MHVFDFDGTLFETPDPEVGKPLYFSHYGQTWPHKGWVSRPESLQPPMRILPGPVLPLYGKYAGRGHTKTVVMSGRIRALEPEVCLLGRCSPLMPHM